MAALAALDGDPGPRPDRTRASWAAGAGPHDYADPRAGRSQGLVDFGSLRLPVPPYAHAEVTQWPGEPTAAVHVLVPSGRISLRAMAAPRSAGLWDQFAEEVATGRADKRQRVRFEWGDWGREVVAETGRELTRFIGIDGPRWMLFGVATGPTAGSPRLAASMRELIRFAMVVRGDAPLPVRTLLPLLGPGEHTRDSEPEPQSTPSASRPWHDVVVEIVPPGTVLPQPTPAAPAASVVSRSPANGRAAPATERPPRPPAPTRPDLVPDARTEPIPVIATPRQARAAAAAASSVLPPAVANPCDEVDLLGLLDPLHLILVDDEAAVRAWRHLPAGRRCR